MTNTNDSPRHTQGRLHTGKKQPIRQTVLYDEGGGEVGSLYRGRYDADGYALSIANAAELVRRWNAFEDGQAPLTPEQEAAINGIIQSLEDIDDVWEGLTGECTSDCDCSIHAARIALAAARAAGLGTKE